MHNTGPSITGHSQAPIALKEQWPVYFGSYCIKVWKQYYLVRRSFPKDRLVRYADDRRWIARNPAGACVISLPITMKGTYAVQGNYRKPFSCYEAQHNEIRYFTSRQSPTACYLFTCHWWRTRPDTPKRSNTSTRLHGVAAQKTAILKTYIFPVKDHAILRRFCQQFLSSIFTFFIVKI